MAAISGPYDMRPGDKLYSRDGREEAVVTHHTRPCGEHSDDCLLITVEWPDGRLTDVCNMDVAEVSAGVWQLMPVEYDDGEEDEGEEENTNCLQGMKCPQCGSREPFRIVITTTVLMWDNGSDDDRMGGHQEWDETSYCECDECGKAGVVADFTTREEA